MQIPNWEDKTILVVEDEDINYIFIEEALLMSNARLLWAKDGEEAIEFIKSNSVDLVLMDIKMPNMNGYEATEAIKKLQPKVPIIAQTAFAISGEKEQILNVGCDDYISKPIKVETLYSVLNKWID